MRLPNAFYFSRWYRYWYMWQTFLSLVKRQRHIKRFEKLIVWAKRKRLKSVGAVYQRQFEDLYIHHHSECLRYRHLLPYVQWCDCILEQINPA